eukprot:6241580-Karenia_brevis.AAC.1
MLSGSPRSKLGLMTWWNPWWGTASRRSSICVSCLLKTLFGTLPWMLERRLLPGSEVHKQCQLQYDPVGIESNKEGLGGGDG